MDGSISGSPEGQKLKLSRLVWISAVIVIAITAGSVVFGQVLNQRTEPQAADLSQAGTNKQEIRGTVKVTIQPISRVAFCRRVGWECFHQSAITS